MKHLKQYAGWVAAFIFAVAVITVYKTFDNLSNIFGFFGTILKALGPFIAAFVIAYLLNLPAMWIKDKLESHVKNKFVQAHSYGIAITGVYVIGLALLSVTLSRLIPALYSNILDLYTNFPTYRDNLVNYLNKFEIFQRLGITDPNNQNLLDAVYAVFQKVDMTQLSKYASGIKSFTSGVLNGVIALIASIYMLLDKERIKSGIIRMISLIVPKDKADDFASWVSEVNEIFTSYICSRLICGLITGATCAVAMLVLKVKYAPLLGLFIGLMDLIPYFGSIISCVVSILITLITGGIFKAIYVGICLLVIQQIDGNLLAPKIMGDSLEVRPITIIFGVSVGGTLFGFAGMILSVPVLAIIKSVASSQMQRMEGRKNEGEKQ